MEQEEHHEKASCKLRRVRGRSVRERREMVLVEASRGCRVSWSHISGVT